MNCAHCAQAASVHVTEIVGGQIVEKHLCAECAAQTGTASPPPRGTWFQKMPRRMIDDHRCQQCSGPVDAVMLGHEEWSNAGGTERQRRIERELCRACASVAGWDLLALPEDQVSVLLPV